MKRIRSILTLLCLLACMTLAITSCGGGSDTASIWVDPDSYEDTCELGDTVDLSALKVYAVNKSGDKTLLDSKDYTVGSLSTDTLGEKTVEITYGSFTATITVTVVEVNREISGFEMPAFVTLFENATAPQQNKEVEFIGEIVYRVGDDNPFIFLPTITTWGEDGPITLDAYRSVSVVEIKRNGEWVTLSADGVADYVAINEETSSYDFTELAIGETFRLTVAPYYMPEGEDFSLSFEFAVVDGWNVYTAADLSRMDNTKPEDWAAYKAAHGVDDTPISALVFHTSLALTDADVPAAAFFNEGNANLPETVGTMDDGYYLYERTLAAGETFFIYGNAFTLDVSAITPVHHTEYGNDFSNACLFKFYGLNVDKTYGGNTFVNLNGLSIIGNSHRNNNAEETERSLGGLLLVKLDDVSATVEQCIFKSAFIGILFENNTEAVVEATRIYDSLQNSMFLWGGVDVTVDNCECKRTGGPSIIVQHVDPAGEDSANRIPNLTVCDNSVIESKVNGTEVWFVSAGFSTVAGQVAVMSGAISQASEALGLKPMGFTDEDGYMNAQYVVMSDTYLTTSESGVQAGVSVSGEDGVTEVINSLSGQNPNVQNLMAILSAAGQDVASIPIFQTSGSGAVMWTDGTQFYVLYDGNPMTKLADYIAATYDTSFFSGEYLTLYMNGMAFAFPLEYAE